MKKIIIKLFSNYTSKWVVLFVDIILVVVAFFISYFLKFDASFDFDIPSLLLQLPLLIIISLISFLLVGSYKGIIRHTGARDALNVILGTTLIVISLFVLSLISRFYDVFKPYSIPFSIILINYLVTSVLLLVSRFIFKYSYETLLIKKKMMTNVLIYGAGESGVITYNAIKRDGNNKYNIVGFIDDNKSKVGKKLNRVVIYALKKVDKKFVEKHKITEVIISIQNIKSDKLLNITDDLFKLGLDVKITPPLSKWVQGNLQPNQIKQLKIEDLLNRKPISIDNPIIKKDVHDKVVMVTGAAGSIGSEIVRQLSKYSCRHIIMVDQAESSLYDLQQELIQERSKNFTSIVADVRDKSRMEQIFEEYTPQKIYHAAAYKHVPLMENSPYEAIRVNILGTKIVSDLAVKYDVERFVMVSTDKAVNPTNVMGATKRVAELYISCLSKKGDSNTKFTITRFGNVLGSNGSVIPLFKKQIKKGGPLTVTHKNITRYFMTIPEACSLVIEAGTMGVGGEIYIFDMGKSVKIFDIAKKLIQLSGLRYPEDIDIKITGLRPGEKLYEELLANGENTTKTYHKKIMIAKNQDINSEQIFLKINRLCEKSSDFDTYETVKKLKEIVPEYISNNSIYEKLDN